MLGLKVSSLVELERVLLSWLQTAILEGMNSCLWESWVPAPRSAPQSSLLEPGMVSGLCPCRSPQRMMHSMRSLARGPADTHWGTVSSLGEDSRQEPRGQGPQNLPCVVAESSVEATQGPRLLLPPSLPTKG